MAVAKIKPGVHKMTPIKNMAIVKPMKNMATIKQMKSMSKLMTVRGK